MLKVTWMWDLSLLLGGSGLENSVQMNGDAEEWSHENWRGLFKGRLGFQAGGRKSPSESWTRQLLSGFSGWWTGNCVLSCQAGQWVRILCTVWIWRQVPQRVWHGRRTVELARRCLLTTNVLEIHSFLYKLFSLCCKVPNKAQPELSGRVCCLEAGEGLSCGIEFFLVFHPLQNRRQEDKAAKRKLLPRLEEPQPALLL